MFFLTGHWFIRRGFNLPRLFKICYWNKETGCIWWDKLSLIKQAYKIKYYTVFAKNLES